MVDEAILAGHQLFSYISSASERHILNTLYTHVSSTCIPGS